MEEMTAPEYSILKSSMTAILTAAGELEKLVERVGDPMLRGYAPGGAEDFLRQIGFIRKEAEAVIGWNQPAKSV